MIFTFSRPAFFRRSEHQAAAFSTSGFLSGREEIEGIETRSRRSLTKRCLFESREM